MLSLLPKRTEEQNFLVSDIQNLYEVLRKLYIDYDNTEINDHLQLDCVICQIDCVEKVIGCKLKQLKQQKGSRSGCLT